MQKYRLEFNQNTAGHQWHFEFESQNSHTENTFGWRTIAINQESLKLSVFVNFIEAKYKHRISLKEVQSLWTAFTDSDSIGYSGGYGAGFSDGFDDGQRYEKPGIKYRMDFSGLVRGSVSEYDIDWNGGEQQQKTPY